MDFMTVKMSAYQLVCHVRGSVRMPPHIHTNHNGNVEMSADHMMNMGMQNGGNVLMVPAEIRGLSVTAHSLEAVQKTKFCADTTPGCEYCLLLIASQNSTELHLYDSGESKKLKVEFQSYQLCLKVLFSQVGFHHLAEII